LSLLSLSLTVELVLLVVLVSLSVARPCRLLNVSVTVDAVLLLYVVRERQVVVQVVPVVKATWILLDHKVMLFRYADVDVGWVGVYPVTDLVARVVDDTQFLL
jgi:hypothetical protein